MPIFPKTTFERNIIRRGYDAIVGIDEVGMGAFAGPVVACAVVLDELFYQTHRREFARLRDSKLLTSHQREEYASRLREHPAVRHAIGVASVREIDGLNVLGASRRAMYRAIAGISIQPLERVFVLVDGNKCLPDYIGDQEAIIRGDQSVFAIAAASVIAKVHRDALMIACAKKYPHYGFEAHKGYGTTFHRRALVAQGPCPLHRRSFASIGALDAPHQL